MLPLGSLDDESEGEVKVIILKPVSKQSLLKLGPVMFAFIIRILTKKSYRFVTNKRFKKILSNNKMFIKLNYLGILSILNF